MRDPLHHALNIGTLALWLSVTGFGAVAIWVPGFTPEVTIQSAGETTLLNDDFSVEDTADDRGGQSTPPDVPETPASDPVRPLPAPPALPALTDPAPLPEIPDLPSRETRSSEAPGQPEPATRPAPSAKPGPPKTAASKTGNAAAGMSTAARIAAGRTPRAFYPPYSRRNGQTGTVVVQFTVDTAGRVSAASVYSSSNWPLLDREALRAVRTWRYPPGDVMKLVRPIVFQIR